MERNSGQTSPTSIPHGSTSQFCVCKRLFATFELGFLLEPQALSSFSSVKASPFVPSLVIFVHPPICLFEVPGTTRPDDQIRTSIPSGAGRTWLPINNKIELMT